MNRDYGKTSTAQGYADGGKVDSAPAPPQLGGAAGQAEKALSGRAKQIDDQERKALGYRDGGKIKGLGYSNGGEMGGSDIDQGRAMPVTSSGGDKPAGLFDRLKAGNIDDSSSDAYRRYGAGGQSKDSGSSATTSPVSRGPVTASDLPAADSDGGGDSDSGATTSPVRTADVTGTPLPPAGSAKKSGKKFTAMQTGKNFGDAAAKAISAVAANKASTAAASPAPSPSGGRIDVSGIDPDTLLVKKANGGLIGGSSRYYGKKSAG